MPRWSGSCKRSLRLRQWALDRHTGRPLASLQALKHGFADMEALAGSMPCYNGRGRCRRRRAASNATSIAKSYRDGGRLVQACVQMHGGIGVTWGMTCTCICGGLRCTAPVRHAGGT